MGLNDETPPSAAPRTHPPRVALFVTCLVDLFRPNIGFAAVKLLESAGCVVDVPMKQVCCGQPAYNSGDAASAREIARQVITTFSDYDYVVGPSGSCMATIRKEYPKMFDAEPDWRTRAEALSARSHELLSFLVDVMKFEGLPCRLNGVATYHDSCSGLRSLSIKEQPRALLARVEGLSLTEMQDADVCCGFGGTFCVKYPEISTKMVSDKVANVAGAKADVLLGGDLGCLLNMAGRLRRLGRETKVYHAAEVLAGMTDGPSIGEGRDD
ncbi:MAG: (Fe-S)-binding protein [Hyphomicrobium sp.]